MANRYDSTSRFFSSRFSQSRLTGGFSEGGTGIAIYATAAPTELTRDQVIFDSGAARGLSAATVPVTGTTTAADGVAIQARAVSLDDGGATTTDWQPVGNAASGVFSGTLDVGRSTSWFQIETRVGGGAATRAANRFAAGHVWAIWEQSGIARCFNEVPNNAADLYEPITAPGDVQYIHRQAPGVVVPVTEANKNAAPVTPAGVTMANALTAMHPGEKFMVVLHTKSGTDLPDAMSTDAEDPDGRRDFAEEQAMHATAVADGSQVGTVFIPGWVDNHYGSAGNIPRHFMAAFTGRYPDGTLVDADALFSLDQMTRLPVATLYDGTTLDVDGRDLSVDGFYDARHTRISFFGPHGRYLEYPSANTPSSGDFATIDDYPLVSETQGAQNYLSIVKAAREDWTVAKNPAVLPYPGENEGAKRDYASNDTAHTTSREFDGHQRRLAQSAFLMSLVTGLHSMERPRLTHRLDEASGAYADFWSDDVDLTTERVLRGETQPAATDPHHTQVAGWCINDRPASRAELVAAPAGHPAGEGRGICRVWPVSGSFAFADKLSYGQSAVAGHWIEEDYDRETYKDYLIGNPGLPETYPISGITVDFQHDDVLPSTLSAPDLFGVADVRFQHNSTGVIGSYDQMYIVFKGRINERTSRNTIAARGSGNPNILVETNDTITMKTGSTTVEVPAQYGVFVELHFLFDNANGVMRISDGDGNVLAEDTTTGESGNFSSNQRWGFFRGGGFDALNADMEYIEQYLGQTDDTGTPDYAVTAQAASPFYAVTGAMSLSSGTPTDGAV